MAESCGAVAVLRPGGPVRVPLRECCVAVLLGARSPVTVCSAVGRLRPRPRPKVVEPWP